MNSFQPNAASTVNINVSSTTQSKPLTDSLTSQVRVYNAGTADAFVEFGGAAVTAAAATGTPVPSGVVEVFTVKADSAPVYVAAIAAGSSGVIYFTPGAGV